MSEKLIAYYNKFNEEKRLDSRHGQVEFRITMKYIHKYLEQMNSPSIIEVGAGTGRYCVSLANEGYDVSAIELVKSNLGTLKAKKSSVKAYLGNALDLSRFKDNSFDCTLVLGPLYHLKTKEEQVQALQEAKRITKNNGIIMVAYVLNDYSVIQHAFIDGNILNCLDQLDESFQIHSPQDLYNRVRIEQIDELNEIVSLQRLELIAPDGPTDYLRPVINKMSEEEFEIFIKYVESIAERKELLGASSHLLDILKVNK
ncbi:class I SAM-dependent methyltransferase [Floccifex sp.]|uniref:class I SAM-dependent methyltransferase n=1 Tax=Floccifex sp. TaxID=2815810 RepID=UPI002A75B46E|nr:class I SAM-dependent methyltransferase [Floccifex sp.]MDD7280509.1 class I SAM-dependent methyltransferase [Erysipelotrichaceae bacterium]MDY2958537.1 class I SAM-dependent methyltransferase [Floccifex sp.]